MLKRCLQPGCNALTHQSRCPRHTETPDQRKARGLTGRRGSGPGWRKLRQQIINRDEGRCVSCFQPSHRLEVHHLNGNAHDNRQENLASLCPKCHRNIHKLGAPWLSE